jgi:hypothetical protein
MNNGYIDTRHQQALSRFRQSVLELQRQRQKLESCLLERFPLVGGSLAVVYKVCGKPGCRCAQTKEQRHGPFLYLSFTKKGKGRTIHLPKKWEEPVREGVEATRRYRRQHRDWQNNNEKIEKLWKKIEGYRKHKLPYEPKKKR